MERGYIKLYRKIEDSPIFADDHLFKLFIWILLRATRQPIALTIPTGRGKTIVTLNPGQAIIGRKTIARKLHWPQSSARNRLARLAQILVGKVDIQVDTHFSIISIRNYERYQGLLEEDRTSKWTPKRTGKGQAKDTNKNYKNDKNISYTPDFGKFWSVYPRRIGKQVAFLAWVKVIVTYPPTDIISAAKEYAGECERERREERYIMHPSTFLSKDRWKDYCLTEVSGAR